MKNVTDYRSHDRLAAAVHVPMPVVIVPTPQQQSPVIRTQAAPVSISVPSSVPVHTRKPTPTAIATLTLGNVVI